MFGGGYTGFAFYWPSDLDARATEEGEKRPVYLRNFVCGESRIRFWDLDRFWSLPPEIVIFRARLEEPELDQAFLRFASSSGVVLLETGDGWKQEQTDFVRDQARSGVAYPVIQERLITRFPDVRFRFYFPGPIRK